MGTAPIYNIEPSEAETALFAFIVPTLNIPIQIPVAVRTGSDYGLNFKVSEITQVTPLAGADLTFWGFPADNVHEAQRFPKGTTGRPSGCVGRGRHELPLETNADRNPGPPPDRQPERLHRTVTADEAQGPDLPGPGPLLRSEKQLPTRHRL